MGLVCSRKCMWGCSTGRLPPLVHPPPVDRRPAKRRRLGWAVQNHFARLLHVQMFMPMASHEGPLKELGAGGGPRQPEDNGLGLKRPADQRG